MLGKLGYAMVPSADGTFSFVQASRRDRIRGKLMAITSIYFKELPSSRGNKGSSIPAFLHEPNNNTLGVQITADLNQQVVELIPEIILLGVFLNKDEEDDHASGILCVYKMKSGNGESERVNIPMSMWGVS